MNLRIRYLLGLIVIGILFSVALYIQKHDGISPCPLCILQRLDLGLLAILFFFGAVFCVKKIGRYIIGSLSTLVSLAGVFLAGRQVWLQHLPADKNADCGASLDYLMKVLPWDQVAQKIFSGTAECAQVGSQLMHLSIAEWSLVSFLVFLVFSVYQTLRS